MCTLVHGFFQHLRSFYCRVCQTTAHGGVGKSSSVARVRPQAYARAPCQRLHTGCKRPQPVPPRPRRASLRKHALPTASHWLLTTAASGTTATDRKLSPRVPPTASHWLQTAAASATTATARKPTDAHICQRLHTGCKRPQPVAPKPRRALDRTSPYTRGWEPRHFEAILSIKLCARAMNSRGASTITQRKTMDRRAHRRCVKTGAWFDPNKRIRDAAIY